MTAATNNYHNGFSFAIKSEGFIMDNKEKIEGHDCFVVNIPEWEFVEDAKTFAHFNNDNVRARIYYALLQLWIFVLHVLTIRIGKNMYKSVEFPIKVYLETLRDCNNRLTNAHRLWVFENAAVRLVPTHSIREIFKQAILSDKRYDATGSFLDYSPVQVFKDVKVGGGAVQIDQQQGQNAGSDPAAQAKKNTNGSNGRVDASKLMQHELYKIINGPDMYARCADIYTGLIFYTRNNASMYDINVMSPDLIFNIETAFKICDKNICPGQRNIENYRMLIDPEKTNGDKDNYRYKLEFWKDTFRMPLFELNPYMFFFKCFPYTQIDETQMLWSQFMEKLARVSFEKELEKSSAKRGYTVTTGEYIKVTDNKKRNPNATVKSRTLLSQLDNEDKEVIDPNETDEQREIRETNARYEDKPMSDEERRVHEQAKMDRQYSKAKRMPLDMMNEIAANFDVGAKSNDNIELKDLIASFAQYYKYQKLLLKTTYADEPEKLTGLLENLRTVFYQKFEMHCMDEHSDVSKPQQKCNDYFKKNKLADRCFNLPVTDPTKTVIENFLIWHANCLHIFEGVAISNKNITFGYIMAGDRWRRQFGEDGLHLNLVLTGRNATSKTNTMQKILLNILKESCTEINESSLKADTVNSTTTDDIFYSDDGSFASNFKNAGDDSTAKSHRTTQIITRSVLEFIKDSKGSSAREKKIYKNLMICLYIMCTNETLHDLEKLPGAMSESVKAFYYRYVPIEALEYESVVMNIPGMQAMMDDFEDADRDKRQTFRDYNIRFHIISGWAQKLNYIDPDLFKVDMRPFGDMWTRLTIHLSPEHRRVRQQVYLFAQQLCILDAYLNEHCVPTGEYYGKPFSITQLKTWRPILFEHHVFIALSFFRGSFMSPISEPVIDVMANLMNISLTVGDKRVVFDEIEKAKSEIDKLEKERKEKEKKEQKEKERIEKDIENQKKKHEEAAKGKKKADAPLQPIYTTLHAPTTPATGGFNKNRPATNDDDDDDDDDDEEVQKKPAVEVPQQPEEPAPYDLETEVDATYVHFRMTEDEFASYLVMYNRDKQSKVQPSKAQTLALLHKLKNTPIHSKKLVLKSIHAVFPLEDEASKVVMMPALKVNHHNGTTTFSVHFGLLKQNSDYRDPVKKAILSFCHAGTKERNLLLAIDDVDFPWLYQVVTLKPNKDYVMEIENNSHLMDHQMMRSLGSMAKELKAERQVHQFTTVNDCDLDSFFIMRNMRDDFKEGKITPVDALNRYHPLSISGKLLAYYKNAVMNNETVNVQGLEVPIAIAPYPHYDKYELHVYEKVKTNYKRKIEGRHRNDDEEDDKDLELDQHGNPKIPKKYLDGMDKGNAITDGDNEDGAEDDDENKLVYANYYSKDGRKLSVDIMKLGFDDCDKKLKKNIKKAINNIKELHTEQCPVLNQDTVKEYSDYGGSDNEGGESDNDEDGETETAEQRQERKRIEKEKIKFRLSRESQALTSKLIPTPKSNAEIKNLIDDLSAVSRKRKQEQRQQHDDDDDDDGDDDDLPQMEDMDEQGEEEGEEEEEGEDEEEGEEEEEEEEDEFVDIYQDEKIDKEANKKKKEPTAEEESVRLNKRIKMMNLQKKLSKNNQPESSNDVRGKYTEEEMVERRKKNGPVYSRLRAMVEFMEDQY